MHDNDLADLELSPDQMQTLGDCVMRRVVEHLSTLEEQPVRGAVNTAAECRTLRTIAALWQGPGNGLSFEMAAEAGHVARRIRHRVAVRA